jgi:hypothetical protein
VAPRPDEVGTFINKKSDLSDFLFIEAGHAKA